MAHHHGRSFLRGHWTTEHKLADGNGEGKGNLWVTFDDHRVSLKTRTPKMVQGKGRGKSAKKLLLPGSDSAAVLAYV